ncbi:hypothetical protein HN803_05935 [candidate division WWE3 bacterium]|jgi:hypothetical protein|nr:hypothetical protein [candidate division WWE3 bacterium]MBT7350295.1 hypothetical protein [candidate division WWE3 bacterium]
MLKKLGKGLLLLIGALFCAIALAIGIEYLRVLADRLNQWLLENGHKSYA